MESRTKHSSQAEPRRLDSPPRQVAAVLYAQPGAGDSGDLEAALRRRDVTIRRAHNRYAALIETLCAAGPRRLDGRGRPPAALIVIDPQDVPAEHLRRLDEILEAHRPTAVRRGFDTKGARRLEPLNRWLKPAEPGAKAPPDAATIQRNGTGPAPSLRLAGHAEGPASDAEDPEDRVELSEEEIAMLLGEESPRLREGTNPTTADRRTTPGGDDA